MNETVILRNPTHVLSFEESFCKIGHSGILQGEKKYANVKCENSNIAAALLFDIVLVVLLELFGKF